MLNIDPSLERVSAFRSLVDDTKYQVIHAQTGEEGWKFLLTQPIDLVICYPELPDLSGFFLLCQRLKSNLDTPYLGYIPFVLIVDRQTPSVSVEAGVDGLLRWPFEPVEVELLLKTFTKFSQVNLALDRTNQRLATLSQVFNYLGLLDAVTYSFNRQALFESLPVILTELAAQLCSFSLLRIDIDNYTDLQDKYPPRVINELLLAIAGRLRNNTSPYSLLYRQEPNSFLCVTLEDDMASAQALAVSLLRVISNHPFAVDFGLLIPVTVSIGV